MELVIYQKLKLIYFCFIFIMSICWPRNLPHTLNYLTFPLKKARRKAKWNNSRLLRQNSQYKRSNTSFSFPWSCLQEPDSEWQIGVVSDKLHTKRSNQDEKSSGKKPLHFLRSLEIKLFPAVSQQISL